MAIAVASSSSAGNNSASTSVVVTKPSGLAVGDLMIAKVLVFDSSTAITTPSGWTLLTSRTTATFSKISCFYIVATSTEVAASNFTFSFTSAQSSIAVIARINGGYLPTLGTGVPFTPAGIETLALVIGYGGDNGSRTTNFNNQSLTGGMSPTFTEIYDTPRGTTAAISLAIAHAIYTSMSQITAFGVNAQSTIDESSSILIYLEAQASATAQISHLDSLATPIGLESTNTATTQISHIDTTPSLSGLESKNSSDSTQWINETTNPTTWINETL